MKRIKVQEALDLRKHLQLRIHFNHLLEFKEQKVKKLLSIQKVEKFLLVKRRKRVLNGLKTKLERTCKKEANARKAAIFNLNKRQKWFPVLRAFNCLRDYTAGKQMSEGSLLMIRKHRARRFLRGMKQVLGSERSHRMERAEQQICKAWLKMKVIRTLSTEVLHQRRLAAVTDTFRMI